MKWDYCTRQLMRRKSQLCWEVDRVRGPCCWSTFVGLWRQLTGRTSGVGTAESWGWWLLGPKRCVFGIGVARRKILWSVWLAREGRWRLRQVVGTCMLMIGPFGRWWHQISCSDSTTAARENSNAWPSDSRPTPSPGSAKARHLSCGATFAESLFTRLSGGVA